MSIKELKGYTTDNVVYAIEESKRVVLYRGTELIKGGGYPKPAVNKKDVSLDLKGKALRGISGIRVYVDRTYKSTCVSIGASLTERVTIPIIPKKLPQDFWDVVEKHLPGYYHQQDVGDNNALSAFLDGSTDEVPPILREVKNKKAVGKTILEASNYALYAEAVGYRDGYYAFPTETWEITVRLELPQGRSPAVVISEIQKEFVCRMSEDTIYDFRNIEASITDIKKVEG